MPGPKRNLRHKVTGDAGVLSSDFVLVVGSEYGLDEFRSSDDCEELMRALFKELGFRYEVPFVCASVREQVTDAPPGAGKTTESTTADAYGQPFVLKPDLLDRALIACAGDFKNVMSNAFVRYLQDGTPLPHHREYFRELSGLSVVEKRSAIIELHRLLVESENKFGTYVEVRLLGPAESAWSDTIAEELSGFLAAIPDDIELE